MASTAAVFEVLLCVCFAAWLTLEVLPSFEAPVAFRAAVDLLAPTLVCLTDTDWATSGSGFEAAAVRIVTLVLRTFVN
jgi:hypothetical protein